MLAPEIAHVAHKFAFGKLGHEPCFEATGVAQVGFESENRLFGGHPTRMFAHIYPAGGDTLQNHKHQGKKSALAGIVVLWDYLCRALL